VYIVIVLSRYIISFIISHNIINSGVEFMAIIGLSILQLVTYYMYNILPVQKLHKVERTKLLLNAFQGVVVTFPVLPTRKLQKE